MNINDIKDLPPKYRQQAEIKLNKMKGPVCVDQPKRNKHGNIKTKVNGITFDSKKEANRYLELTDLLRAGEISDLRLQVNITLTEGYTTHTGKRIPPTKYVADFTYIDKDGNRIVEDVKSDHTRKNQTYRVKMKLVADKYGITITEVVM